MAKKKKYTDCLVSPLKTGIANFNSIVNFYMYYAPDIDSAQSRGRIEGEAASRVLNKMLSTVNMTKSSRFLKKRHPHSWAKMDLGNDSLDFEIPRLLCHRVRNRNGISVFAKTHQKCICPWIPLCVEKKKGELYSTCRFRQQYEKNSYDYCN